MARKLTTDRFRTWCRQARQLWPLDKPVRVRRLKLGDTCGECWDRGAYYEIHINSDLCKQATADTLVHEWAHLVCGEVGCVDDASRLPVFGVVDPDHDAAFWLTLGSMTGRWIST